MVGWHHRLDGHEFEQAPGIGDGQGSLVCCSPWAGKDSDTTEWLNWTDEGNQGSPGKKPKDHGLSMTSVKWHSEITWKGNPVLIEQSLPICYLDPSPQTPRPWWPLVCFLSLYIHLFWMLPIPSYPRSTGSWSSCVSLDCQSVHKLEYFDSNLHDHLWLH